MPFWGFETNNRKDTSKHLNHRTMASHFGKQDIGYDYALRLSQHKQKRTCNRLGI